MWREKALYGWVWWWTRVVWIEGPVGPAGGQSRGIIALKAISDLINDHDGNVVPSGKGAEVPAEADECLGATAHLSAQALAFGALELGAKVGRYAVDDDQADAEPLDGGRDLV